MKRINCLTVALFALLWCSRLPAIELAPKPLENSIQKAIDKVLPATVAVGESGNGRILGAFSGVIVSSEGHVLTAAHAVEPGKKYRVVLSDGRRFSAKGLGRELVIDCGLIKITDSGKWPYATMGWSATLEPNQPCLSLGHPGFFDGRRGPVVRFGRIVEPLSSVKGFLHSTCLMEPGDSGGPLFDLSGQIIGIHSMIFQSTENNYEVPIDQFRRYWNELNQEETFEAPEVTVPPTFGVKYKYVARRGRGNSFRTARRGPRRVMEVAEVLEESLGAKAGLLKGDQLLSIDGRRVSSPPEVDGVLFRHFVLKRGTVKLEIRREDDRLSIPLEIPDQVAELPKISSNQSVLKTSLSSSEDELLRSVPELEDFPAQFRDKEARLDDVVAVVSSELNGRTRQINATILSDGVDPRIRNSLAGTGTLLVSKNSMVGKEPLVRLPNDDTVPATVVTRDVKNDLVLLRIDVKTSKGIELVRVKSTPVICDRGSFMLSPQSDGVGFVSVLGAGAFRSRKRESVGFLGVYPDLKDEKVVVERIIDGAAADEVDLRVGDVIASIDGVEIQTADAMISELQKHLAGDRITLRGSRDEEQFELDVVLGARPEDKAHAADMFKRGKSPRRDGFDSVRTHDAQLKPSECGGPLYNLDDELVGINIARFSRSRTYAIPASVVKQFVREAIETHNAKQ